MAKQKKPRTLQEIFNLMIALGYYNETMCYMCNAVKRAREEHLITGAEKVKTLASLRNYCGVNGFGTTSPLINTLRWNGREHSFKSMLAIYQNWAKRPKLIPRFKCC